MSRPIFAVVAALIAALLLLGAASCSRTHLAAAEVCPDGTVIRWPNACPLPPTPPPPPPPMANGNGDYPPPPPEPERNGGHHPGPAPRPAGACLACERPDRDGYAGSDDESYAVGDAAEGPDFAAAARNRQFLGKAAFIRPEEMEVENWHPLEFYVGPTKAAIEVETEGRELTPLRDIWMAPTMRVTLLPDPYFEVKAQTEDVQDLGTDRTANWKWKVMPLTDGRHRLQAHVEVLIIGPDGKPLRKPDGSLMTQDKFDRYVDIVVEVGTWRGFLNAINNASDLGDKLSTLIRSWDKTLIALVGLIGTLGTLVVAVRKLMKGGRRPRGAGRGRRRGAG